MPQQVTPIPKVGPFCPSGYRVDGKYCVAQLANAKMVFPKSGAFCPSGYRADGNYCIEN